MHDPTEHTFTPCDRRDPIDRHFCAVCGLHRDHCTGSAVREDEGIPLPPDPEDYS